MPLSIDETEFERLYRRWHPEAVALCRRLLGRREDAEDAAQEAFLRAWLGHAQYSATLPFWPWLATIAQRVCVDHRRRTTFELVDDPDRATLEATPERLVVADEDLRTVVEVLDRLRPAQRRALVLRQVDGWSYRRIAALEGVTEDSVRGVLKRARASLRRSGLRAAVFDVTGEAEEPLEDAVPVGGKAT